MEVNENIFEGFSAVRMEVNENIFQGFLAVLVDLTKLFSKGFIRIDHQKKNLVSIQVLDYQSVKVSSKHMADLFGRTMPSPVALSCHFRYLKMESPATKT